MTAGLWDHEIFVEKLREIGECAYHDKHPFHVAMNEGRLSPEAVRGWVANRFYYQRSIPVKDAAILSNCPLPEVRRVWIHRIVDHDGVLPRAVESAVLSGQAQSRTGRKFVEDNEHYSTEGGVEAWLRLGEACGLSRAELIQDKNLQPGVRFAVDAYVNFARTRPWPVAARRDSNEALEITIEHCNTRELQDAAVRALQFKCDVLWSMLDAIQRAYANIKEGGFQTAPPWEISATGKPSLLVQTHDYDS